jgi:hypothetical protein
VDARGIPIGAVTAPANRHDSPLLSKTLDAVSGTLGELPERVSVHLDRGDTTLSSPASACKKNVGCSLRSPRRASLPR